jgi:hypothetical protein
MLRTIKLKDNAPVEIRKPPEKALAIAIAYRRYETARLVFAPTKRPALWHCFWMGDDMGRAATS